MEYIKKCNKCGIENSVHTDICICGENLIMIVPTLAKEIENRKFRRCSVCKTKNYLEDNRDVRKCSNCGYDRLYVSQIEEDNEEVFDVEKNKNEQEISAVSSNENLLKLHSKINDDVLTITEKGVVLGRLGSEYADYFLEYECVSKIHCEIKYIDNLWKIKDLSSYGTYINAKKIIKGEFINLNDGDLLSFANVHFEVKI